MKRAQSSVEYLFIAGLSLLLIIPASFLFLSYSKSSEDAVVAAKINRLGTDILIKAEELYIIGNNSWATIELSIPGSVQNVTIYAEKELIITYFTQSGISEAVFFSDINITNETHRCLSECFVYFTEGRNNFRITSRGDHVSILRS